MHTNAVKGVIECHEHQIPVIKCRALGRQCQGDTPETVRARFKRLGIRTEPAREPWLHSVGIK